MIYLFPGLGASEKLFQPLNLSPFEKKVVSFLVPEKNESLTHYCDRLSESIEFNKENIFIGVSFGGILAQEIAKKVPARKIIIISSIKTSCESPDYFKLIRTLPVYKFIPPQLLKKLLVFISEVATRKTADERIRFRALADEADDRVIKWGIEKVLEWDQESPPLNIFHIHGDRDPVFPIRKIRADYVVRRGTHFMIMREITEINGLLMSLLQTESVQSH